MCCAASAIHRRHWMVVLIVVVFQQVDPPEVYKDPQLTVRFPLGEDG